MRIVLTLHVHVQYAVYYFVLVKNWFLSIGALELARNRDMCVGLYRDI